MLQVSDTDITAPEHPLLGARAAGYPQVPNNTYAGLIDHEQRIGRRVHLGMAFARPGRDLLSDSGDRDLARRDDTTLVQCWKPVDRWSRADGNDHRATAYIARQARAVAAIDSPVMIVVHHEPENDLGRAGTATDYRRMWAHVRDVFDTEGATNTVWGIAFMNYPKWDRVIGLLWPEATPPDWVWFNAYGSPSRPDYVDNVARFYRGLADQHWFDPHGALWGIREWSTKGLNVPQSVDYFDAARHAINEGMFPRLSAHLVFDSPGSEGDAAMRIGFDAAGRPAPIKTAAYTDFAHEDAFGTPVAPTGSE